MEIHKNLPPVSVHAEETSDMAEINALAKKKLLPEEVYTFSVRLCDNEVDRDGERFNEETLRELAGMFVGKSGIFDHCWSAKEQTARIYHTELCYENGRLTAAGDGYCYLKGKAYMLRTEKNRDLIEEIEAGIKKEVSVGCSVKEAVCSICGAKDGNCTHVHGQIYDGKLCYTELRGAQDAYEWSFVAVPAQKNAGVMKHFGGSRRMSLKDFLKTQGNEHYLAQLEGLEQEAAMGRSYMKALRRDVLRCACTAETDLDSRIFASALEKLNEGELLELQRHYKSKTEKRMAALPQLPYDATTKNSTDGSAFLI